MQIVAWLMTVISLVCFVLVVVKMFQNGQTGLGIACLLLCWCIGPLIAFIFGWIKVKEWNIMPVMGVWSIAIVVNIVLSVMGVTIIDPEQLKQFQPQQ